MSTQLGCSVQNITFESLVKKPEVLPDDSKIKNIGSICSIRKVTPVELVEDNKLSDEQLLNLEKLKKAQEYEDIVKGARLGLSAYQKPSDGIPRVDLSLELLETLNTLESNNCDYYLNKVFGGVSYNSANNKVYFYSVTDLEQNNPIGTIDLSKFARGSGGGVQADWNATSGKAVILNKPEIYTKAEVDDLLEAIDSTIILYCLELTMPSLKPEIDYAICRTSDGDGLLYEELKELLTSNFHNIVIISPEGTLLRSCYYWIEENTETEYSASYVFANGDNVNTEYITIDLNFSDEIASTSVDYETINEIDKDTITTYYGTSTTFGSTKTCSISNFQYVEGNLVTIKFNYSVPDNSTLNISNTGAKYIYNKETLIKQYTINGGDIATFLCSNNLYHLLNVDKHPDYQVINTSSTGQYISNGQIKYSANYTCASSGTYILQKSNSALTISKIVINISASYASSVTLVFDKNNLLAWSDIPVSFDGISIKWQNNLEPPWDKLGTTIDAIIINIVDKKYASYYVIGQVKETVDALVDVQTNEDGTLTFYKGAEDTITVDLNHTHSLYAPISTLCNIAFSGLLSDAVSDTEHMTVTLQEILDWDDKLDALVSGTNIKTINSQSVLGAGDIEIKEIHFGHLLATLGGSYEFYVTIEGLTPVLEIPAIKDNKHLYIDTSQLKIYIYDTSNSLFVEITGSGGTSITVDSSITGSSLTNPVLGGAIYSALSNKADKIELVTVSSTGDVTLALDPNKFYLFGSIDSLTITLTAGTGFYIYAGKFTSSANWGGVGFNLPNTITNSALSDAVVASKTYEFNILDNVCVIKLID